MITGEKKTCPSVHNQVYVQPRVEYFLGKDGILLSYHFKIYEGCIFLFALPYNWTFVSLWQSRRVLPCKFLPHFNLFQLSLFSFEISANNDHFHYIFGFISFINEFVTLG